MTSAIPRRDLDTGPRGPRRRSWAWSPRSTSISQGFFDWLRAALVAPLPAVWVRYSISTLIVLTIALLRYAMVAEFADFPALFLFTPAIVAIILFLGAGAGLLATTVASVFAGCVLLKIAPIGRLSPSQWIPVTIFALTNLWLNGLVVALRRALIEIDNARAQLAVNSIATAEREAFLSSVLASSTDCIKVLDLDGKLTFMSDGGKRVMEVSDFNAIVGCPWPDFWTGLGHTEAVNAIESARQGRASSFVGRASTMKGTPKWWHVAVSPTLDPQGQPQRILSVSRDITALRESEEERDRFVRLAENSTDFISMAHVNGRVFYMNEAARRMVGLEHADIAKLTTADFIPPDQIATLTTEVLPAVDRDGNWTGELSFRHWHTGERIPVLYTVFPVTGSDGQTIGYSNVTRDFRARKKAEEDMRFMNDELAHRLKNVLAVVQSVAQQTLRNATDTKMASHDLSARLVALSNATGLLTATSWRSADLEEVATRALAPHGDLGQRIMLGGPRVTLRPQVTVAFALALHELATNAAKYGALSNFSGIVTVSWEVVGTGSDARFELTWQEQGGPRVSEPTRRGFGSTLIERSLRSYCDGSALTKYQPEGLVFTVKARAGDITPQ